jgi:RNA-directed DNA polymerase
MSLSGHLAIIMSGAQQLLAATPQGEILSPLLSNIALSVLDEHFAVAWAKMGATSSARQQHRRNGLATYRLIRYADDFVALVAGTRAHAEALREELAAVLRPMGLRLSETKTKIVHIDEGFDFLGLRIQRHRKRGTRKRFVYTYPSKSALAAVKARVRTLTQSSRNQSLHVLLHRLNPVLRGSTNYFRYGVSKATFDYLRAVVWRRVVNWLRRKHQHRNWKWLRRRYLPRWWPTEGEHALFNTGAVEVTRYRYRANRIPSPWVVTKREAVS